jgi:hypothetical protein
MGDDITRNSVYSKFERYADARAIANDCISLSCKLMSTLQYLFIRDEKYRGKVIECSNALESLAFILRNEANELVDKEVEKILGSNEKEANNG